MYTLLKCGAALSLIFSGAVQAGGMSAAVQNERLDLAGKERMLIQRVVKSSCYVLSDANGQVFADAALADVQDFEETLKALIEGSPERGWLPEAEPDVRAALKATYDRWVLLRPAALQVANGDMQDVPIRQIVNMTDDTVGQMNAAVNVMQKHNFDPTADPRFAKTINAAGRQRMLSQKMAKEFCFLYNDVAADKNRAGLQQSFALFDETLTALRTASESGQGLAPAGAKVSRLLDDVAETWSVLRPVIARAIEGEQPERKDFETVVALSDKLLSEMVRAVTGYLENG